MSPSVQAAAGAGATAASTSAAAGASAADVTTDQFLKLLVAEIQNQDPLNPADGTQFLTQLAQFQQVEQGVSTGQNVSAILTDLNSMVASDNGGAAKTQS